MSLLGWVVGAALLDEWGRREKEEREKRKQEREPMEYDRRIRELEGRISHLEAESVRPWERKGRW